LDSEAAPALDDRFPVVIIGGGLAGLTAAAHLAARGVMPVVLEADSRWPGGRLSGGDPETFEFQGKIWSFVLDHGVHALWGGYVNLRATLERFTQTTLIPSSGEEWINRWGKHVRRAEAGQAVRSRWIPAPFHYVQLLMRPRFWRTIMPWDFLSLPGFLFSILWTAGFDPIREQSSLSGLNMKEYFRGWTPNLRATFTGLAQNLLAAPAEAISLTGLIAALRFYTVLRRDTWNPRFFPGNSHDTLIQPLIDAIVRDGGSVLRGKTAVELRREGTGWQVITEDASVPGRRRFRAGHVILAVNSLAAERLLMSSPATQPDAARLKFPGAVRSVVVRIWFSKSPKTGCDSGMFTGDFMLDNFFWLDRLYAEFRAWRENTGGSVIETHIYGSESLLEQPDHNLLILSVDEVQRAFPELRGAFVHGSIRRNSRTHTRLEVPTWRSLFVETPWPGISACGDWIGFETPSLWMERAATTGVAAANRILNDRGGPVYEIAVPPPPEITVRVLAALVGLVRLLLRPAISGMRRLKRATSAIA